MHQLADIPLSCIIEQKISLQKILFILILVFSCSGLNAQSNLDSLFSIWQDATQSDSLRTDAFVDFINTGFLESAPDSAVLLADDLITFGNARKYEQAVSYGYELKGYGLYYQNKFRQSLASFQGALATAERMGLEKVTGSLLNTIGVLYGTLGNQAMELEYYQRSLKVNEELNDQVSMEMALSNIGEIYFTLDNYPRALEYFERGLQLEKEMGDSIGYAMSLNLIAEVFRAQNNFSRALEYSERALKITEEFESSEGKAISFYSIADTYKEQKKYTLALQYFNRGLEINDGGDSEFSAVSLYKIGSIYQEQGDYPKALSFCQRSEELASELGLLADQKNACECLYLAHRALNNGKSSMEYLEKLRTIEDSLNTQETNNRLQQMEIEKQALQDSIATAEKEHLTELGHQKELKEKNQTRNIAIVVALFILLIAAGFYNRWRSVRRSKAIIEKEKERSDNLLLNILPADIAQELKEKGRADARDFDLVSILFTDFKGFTAASQNLSAQDLVSEINTCFEAFDATMDKYGVEKIKTIGDAYMAAGGLPLPTADSVKNTVLAALAVQAFINNRKIALDAEDKPAFEMRVGVHTGPVVAGIVGVKKFQYDVWGDTVNTAARIESNGEAGKVNISQSTYELLKEDSDFTFAHRGKIEAKGKGEIEMYFVQIA